MIDIASLHMWDDARWETISGNHVQIARESGALGELPLALSQRVYVHLFAGELTAAGLLVDEVRTTTEATGSNMTPYGAVGIVAFRGRQSEAIPLIDEWRKDAEIRGEGIGLSVLDWAQAVLYNGLGLYDEACAAAIRVVEHPYNVSISNWGMTELVEAAVRAGKPELAKEARSRLMEMGRVSGTDRALGVVARSEALFSEDQNADELYSEAIDRLSRSLVAVELARSHLLYGEWLRRKRATNRRP